MAFADSRWGSTLEFGADGSAVPYQKTGWSSPETGITWTDGRKAVLEFGASQPSGPVVFEAFVRPYLVAGKLSRQTVRVAVNNDIAGEKTLTKAEFQTCL